MKLGYSFINLSKIQELFTEAEQAGKTLSPAQAVGALGAGIPITLGRARNAMLEVELEGPEGTSRDLMKNIEKYLASKGWEKMEDDAEVEDKV